MPQLTSVERVKLSQGYDIIDAALGHGAMVAQQTLDLFILVRIPVAQPDFRHVDGFLRCTARSLYRNGLFISCRAAHGCAGGASR